MKKSAVLFSIMLLLINACSENKTVDSSSLQAEEIKKPLTFDQCIDQIFQNIPSQEGIPLTIAKVNEIFDGKLPEPEIYINHDNVPAWHGRVEKTVKIEEPTKIHDFWISNLKMEERDDGGFDLLIKFAEDECISPNHLKQRYLGNTSSANYDDKVIYRAIGEKTRSMENWYSTMDIDKKRPNCIQSFYIANNTYLFKTDYRQ